MSEITDKLDELEKRVDGIKDWKQKYMRLQETFDKEKKQWDREREELIATIGAKKTLRDALIQFLNLDKEPRLIESTKETLNLKHKELTVNLTHEEKTLNMTTDTVNGKILYCASTELSKEGFSEAELTGALKEHGWNVGHTTLAPQLGGLARDGTLVRLEGTRPAKYRLPAKFKLNVKKEPD